MNEPEAMRSTTTLKTTVLSLALMALTWLGPAAADTRPAAPAKPTPAAAKGQQAKQPAAKAEKVTSVEGITEYRLSNGLEVLLFPDPSKPTITVNVTYLVGSRNEQYGETGMAHLLEHLLFKGTPRHPNIPQELTSHGARPNGSTWFDRTNYFETFDASDANFDWALDLEADRMVNSFVAKKDLDSEMTVVRNEFEAGENDPRSILEERTLATAFIWHNYGHSTIGARADIENVPIERLQAFYRTYYQPDNAVLLVAGRFDEEKALAKIVQRFGAIPKPSRAILETYTQEPTQDGERNVTLRRVGDVQSICAVYHTAAGSHPDAAPADLLAEVLGATPSGRLHKALVETKKATEVAGYQYQLREPGALVFAAQVRQDMSLDEARDILLRTVEGVAATPPTTEEVERARAALLKNIELTLNSSERVGLTLSEWIGMGDWRLFFLHRDRIKKVTTEDVQRVAAAYLKSTNRTAGVFIPTPKPERAEIPPTPDVAEILKDYKGEEAKGQAEAFDPSPANIEARTKRLSLANGARVALLEKKTRGGSVVVSLALRFGDETSLEDRAAIPGLAGQMLMRGTSRHTRQQIKDELDRLKARASVFGGAGQGGASIETVRENLPEVLKLVAEILREPSFPEDEFEQLRQEQLAGIEEQRSEPQTIAFQAFSRHMNPYPKGDVRYVTTLEEDIENTKAARLADVKAFHREFYGASNAWIAVVGDFDGEATGRLLEELFGSWKSPLPFERIRGQFKDVPAVSLSLEAPDKANAFFVAGENLPLRDEDPDYPALVLGNFMLGGGFLNSRLAVRLRQKEGLSYGVGSQLFAHPFDAAGSFTAFAIYAPENAARLETAFREEIDRVLKDGFAADEVTEAKSGYLQSRQVGRAQDPRLAQTLASYLYYGRTLAWDAALEEKVGALTPAQIHEALKKRLDPAKLTQAKAGDFAKAAAKAGAAKPE
jgi:zinc protease